MQMVCECGKYDPDCECMDSPLDEFGVAIENDVDALEKRIDALEVIVAELVQILAAEGTLKDTSLEPLANRLADDEEVA